MGTRDAMVAGGGHFAWSLLIEGFEYALTTSSDTAGAVAALAGSGWTQALSGLVFSGQFEQAIKPWDHEPDVPTLTFEIFDVSADKSDAVGIAVFKSKPAFVTRLTQPFVATTQATTLHGQSFAALPASGEVFLGKMRVAYSSKTGSTQLNIDADQAGVYAPFPVDTGAGTRNPWGYPTSPGKNLEIARDPVITDTPRSGDWIGRFVALRLHKVTGGVWDTIAQAELVFAGVIRDIQDATSGATVLVCDDIRCKMRDTVLLVDQFVGRAKEGYYLREGDWMFAQSKFGDTASATRINVVESGAVWNSATPQYEFNEGYISIPDLYAKLNEYCDAETDAGRLDGDWAFTVSDASGGVRTAITVRFSATTNDLRLKFYSSNKELLRFMGFTDPRHETDVADSDDAGYVVVASDGGTNSPRDFPVTVVSEEPPLRAMVGARDRGERKSLELEDDIDGNWHDLSDVMPEPYRTMADGQDYGLLMVGDGGITYFAKHDSDTLFTDLRSTDPLDTRADHPIADILFERAVKTLEDEGPLEVRQIALLGGKLSDIITMLFASQEGNTVNHATYDALPFGAGIPWSLLGDSFVNSLRSLEQVSESDAVPLVLERPIALWDAIGAEFKLRFAWLMFRDGGLQFVSPATPNASTADHALTEDNKGAAAGDADKQITSTEITEEHTRNVLKIEYNRDLDDKYHATLTILGEHSAGDKPHTIKARNSYADFKRSGATVEALAAGVATRMMPAFDKPLKRYRRPLLATMWLSMCPGDSVSFEDNFVRDPTTGRRGVSARAGTLMRTFWSFGRQGDRDATLSGECDILYTDEDRTFPMAPAAEFTGAGSSDTVLNCTAHAFSGTSDAVDASHLANGDEVLIVEVDPDDPASADSFTTDVTNVTGSAVTINPGFGAGGNPARDVAKTYRITYRSYADVDTGQRLRSFLADRTDGLVQDTIDPNLYGETAKLDFGEAAASELPEVHSDEMFGDGVALNAAHARHVAVVANHLLNYRVPSMPWYHDTSSLIFNTGSDWHTLFTFRWAMGQLYDPAGRTRLLYLAPRFFSGGGTASVRVTASKYPPRGSSFDNARFREPKSATTFSTTSLSAITPPMRVVRLIPSFDDEGATFVTVEGQGNGMIYGFPVSFLGPLWRARYPRNGRQFIEAIAGASGPTAMWHFVSPSGDEVDLVGTAPLSPVNSPTRAVRDVWLDSLCVQFGDNTSQRMAAAANTVLDVTTGNVVLLWVGRVLSTPAADRNLMGKRTATAGYSLRFTSAGLFAFTVDGTAVQTQTVDLSDFVGQPMIAMGVYDTTNNVHRLHVWVDGEITSSAGTTAGLGTLTNTDTFAVGDHGVETVADNLCAWGAVVTAAAAAGLDEDNLYSLGEWIFGQ